MSDPRQGQGKTFEQRFETFPGEAPGLQALTPQGPIPDASDLLVERAQRPVVVGHTVVAVMTTQHAGKPAMLFGQRRVHVSPRFLAQRPQLACQALALRLALHDEPAVPGPPAVVGEAEKGERAGSPLAALPSSQGRQPAELDQARLVLVERQTELGQPFLEVRQHPPGIRSALEAHHEVSRAVDLHRRALAEPDVKLSPHPAPIAQPRNGFALSTGLLPSLVDPRPERNNAAPSVQPHYRAFLPTPGCSAPVPRLGTRILTGTARLDVSLRIGATGS